MSRTRVVLTTLGAAAAAATLVTATALPANAAVKPYVVKVGTQTKGTVPYTGTTIGASPQIKLSSGSVNMSCASGTASGNVKAGKNKTGKGIATITASTWNTCKGPANLAMTVTQNGTWSLDATGKIASNGDVPGAVSAVQAHVAATSNPSQCNFDVTGSVAGVFSQNPTTNQVLHVNGNGLKIQNVVGCFGLLTNGASATFVADYAITNAVGPIKITGGPTA